MRHVPTAEMEAGAPQLGVCGTCVYSPAVMVHPPVTAPSQTQIVIKERDGGWATTPTQPLLPSMYK